MTSQSRERLNDIAFSSGLAWTFRLLAKCLHLSSLLLFHCIIDQVRPTDALHHTSSYGTIHKISFL